MKPLAWFMTFVAALAIASPSFAQPLAAISLPSGRSTTIEAPGLTRVAVGDGRIAGVVPIGTSQVIVNAKAPGHTTVLVWTRDGRHEYDVTVTEQTLDDLAQMLRGTLDEPGVTVEPIGRALVVKGDVADQSHANRIADVLGRFTLYAKNQKYDIVDAVTVSRPLGAIQAELARETGARDVRVDYDAKGNVMVSGHVRDRAAAETVLQRVRGLAGANLAVDGKLVDRLVLDITQQIDTHVYILEVDKTALTQLGIKLQGAFVDASGVVHYNDPSFPIFENPFDLGPANPGKGTTIGRFIRAEFLAPTLDAIIRNGNARVLSAPDLVSMPGSNAQFLVGGEVPYIVSSQLGTVNVQFKEYGVRLNVTPTILPDGSVESKITPEVSDLDFQNGIVAGGILLPSFKTSRITTDVVTKSGQSIVMAGLLRRQETRNVDKIPGLGDLPILGKLFRSTRYQKAETDVVFVMTPEVVTR
ncbi:MAG TPA: pilus assembly protein N-terminal domain-containing protein [Candidatus Elarobacter sp.]|jgi:pilus assembly protein CpaC|nr:pilus assembly protein N-terminal domain-containing protein [Candidatus Elarobacter sp.]